MAEILGLTCPSCGNRLEIGPEIVRFACANCGTELVVQRGGGIVALVPAADGKTQTRAGELWAEIEDVQTELWQRREGISQEAVYNFFVLLEQVSLKRRGEKKKLSFFGLRTPSSQDQAKWEADVRQTLNSLTVSELDTLEGKCQELIGRKIPMQFYMGKVQRLAQLKREIAGLAR